MLLYTGFFSRPYAVTALGEALADVECYGTPTQLFQNEYSANGAPGFITKKWSDLDTMAGTAGILTEYQITKLLARRFALALFNDLNGTWGYSFSSLPWWQLRDYFSAAPASTRTTPDAFSPTPLFNLRSPPPVYPADSGIDAYNAQCIFLQHGTSASYMTGYTWDPNPLDAFFEAWLIRANFATPGFFGLTFSPQQACVAVVRWMRDNGWLHGNGVAVFKWYNALQSTVGAKAVPITNGTGADIGYGCRADHFKWLKVGGCNWNSSYVQMVLRAMNQCVVVHETVISAWFGPPFALQGGDTGNGQHRGVSSLTAQLVMFHGDQAIRDTGEGCLSPQNAWIPLAEARASWTARLAFRQSPADLPKYGSSALEFAERAIARKYSTVNPVPTTSLLQTLADWQVAMLWPDGGPARPSTPTIGLLTPSATTPGNPSLLPMGWASGAAMLWGGAGAVLAFGTLRASLHGVSSSLLNTDWCLAPKTTRFKAFATRAFAVAAAPTDSTPYVPGQVAASSWAASYFSAYAADKGSTATLNLAQQFFNYDRSLLGQNAFKKVWPNSNFTPYPGGLTAADVGGIGGIHPGGVPDITSYFPVSSSSQFLPSTNGAGVQIDEWTYPAVLDALGMFAWQSLLWVTTIG